MSTGRGPDAPELIRFRTAPHRTLVALSLPVMVSLIAEPLTGLVDTAFVAQLGDAPLAALGVGTTLLSSVIWVFNFLGIGTQTEVAHALGADARSEARETASTALALALVIGTGLAIVLWPLLPVLTRALGATGAIEDSAVVYLQIRLLGAPAVLAIASTFGALRGLHDMRTPLRIAIGVNLLNAGLDFVLIPGFGPIPKLGIAGAAWATVVSHWLGAGLAIAAMLGRLGRADHLDWRRARALLVVGRDLFARTGLLLVFIVLTTREATRLGADAGAAHQVIRQVWLLTALALDAFAAAAQSLVGSFAGADDRSGARHAAAIGTQWALATGVAIALSMWLAGPLAAGLLASEAARASFASAWWIAALSQPLNALSFVTDGIHWGTRDYRYLRNAMALSSALGAAALLLLDARGASSIAAIWSVTAGWIALRAGLGLVRVWPGVGDAPLRRRER
jgi:MATE family multidrug resistance protein